MIILNFSHPLSHHQLKGLELAAARHVDRVIEIKTHLDQQQPFSTQISNLLDSAGFSGEEWQTLPLVVVVPSLAPITAVVLAEVHGRMGYFPPVARLRPVVGSMPPAFEFAEFVNLQEIRDRARDRR